MTLTGIPRCHSFGTARFSRSLMSSISQGIRDVPLDRGSGIHYCCRRQPTLPFPPRSYRADFFLVFCYPTSFADTSRRYAVKMISRSIPLHLSTPLASLSISLALYRSKLFLYYIFTLPSSASVFEKSSDMPKMTQSYICRVWVSMANKVCRLLSGDFLTTDFFKNR